MRTLLFALSFLTLAAGARADTPPDAVREAVRKGLRRLEQGSANYVKNRQCFSCHHQALTMAAFASAGRRGFAVDPAGPRRQLDFTLDTFRDKRERVRKGQSVAGGNTMAAYALFALEAGGHRPDEASAALVEYLLVRQRPDGSWPALTPRPPSEGSTFTNNALALRGLRFYGPGKDAKGAGPLRRRVDAAFDRGRDWLVRNKPADTEDKRSRLAGLVAGGCDPKEDAAARDLLLAEQLPDGSWAQLPGREGDAYATGSVLLALRQAGVKPGDEAYRKGVGYLVRTQKEDGGWIVTTRSRPVQIFFDNGDPGGKNQFISFAATGWAVRALLETVPAR
jgi:N-acyl-D-amino-acid deacylase